MADRCDHEPKYAKGKCRRCYLLSRKATCHPDKPLAAKGKCWSCYQKKGPRPVGSRIPDCHPNKPYAAKGKCWSCWRGTTMRDDTWVADVISDLEVSVFSWSHLAKAYGVTERTVRERLVKSGRDDLVRRVDRVEIR